jgi:uncharacterized protein YjbJ (UPF0337 family)
MVLIPSVKCDGCSQGQQVMNKAMIAGAAMIGGVLLSAGAQAQGTMDKIEGTGKELQGSAKETIGKATGDAKLEWDGKADRVEGTAQNAVGDLKNTAGAVNGKVASLFTRLVDFVARVF